MFSTHWYRNPRTQQQRVLLIVLVGLGQSFKTVGYGCTSSWGGVGAGDAEINVIYISFIVSVQHIGYLRITWTTESRCTVPDVII